MLKIERAGEHLQAVGVLIEAVSADPLDALAFEIDDETRKTTIVLKELKTPARRIGTLIGDYAHNLRSALDHLAWQLVKHPAQPTQQRPPKDKNIAFPIFIGTSYSSASIRGSTPRAQAVIKGLQPHHAREPLALLRELSNWDKHRLVHTIANTLKESSVSGPKEGLESSVTRAPGPLVAGAELASYVGRGNAKVSVTFQATFGVSFKDGPARGRDVEDTLASIHDAVLDTVVRLANEVALDSIADPHGTLL